jgi:hypothetical protein
MVVVRVIEDGQERDIEYSESTFGVVIDGVTKYPAATQTVEVESNGNQETTGTQCGDTKRQTTSTDPFAVTAECIITSEATTTSPDALTVRDVLYRIPQGSEIRVKSAFPIEQPMTVSNVLVTQEEGLVSVNTTFTDGEATAFRCQLQLGAEESQA